MKKEAKFKVGEIVHITDFCSLMEAIKLYPFLMGIEEMQAICGAQYTVYKVISCANVFWYEIGQFGYNVINVPEEFLIDHNAYCERENIKTKVHEAGGFTADDFIGAGRKVNSIIRGVDEQSRRAYLERKQIREGATINRLLREVKEEMKRIDEEYWELPTKYSCTKDKLKFLSGMFVGIAMEDGKPIQDENSSKEISGNVGKFTFEEEAELLLNDINSWSENREVGILLTVFIPSICHYYSILSKNIKESNRSYISLALKNIAFRAAALVALRRRHPLKSPDFNSVITEMIDLHCKKNADYGNSFDKSLDEDDLLVAKIRIGDKVNRFLTLNSNKTQEAKVSDESIEDTLIDLANYCLMTIVWMKNNNPNKK